MTPLPLHIACALVRGWTRFYTCGLSADVRDARRAEIASDLWECQQDLTSRHGVQEALQVLGRLLLGVPDDVAWGLMRVPNGRAVMLSLATLIVVVVAWLYLQVLGPQTLPAPRPLPQQLANSAPPPPPPPPPPRRRPE
jgi:hypothetical protein